MLQNQYFLATHGSRNAQNQVRMPFLKSEQAKKQARNRTPRGLKNAWKHVVFATCNSSIKTKKNALCFGWNWNTKKRAKTRCFRWVFKARMPRESSQKSFGPARCLGIRQKWDLGAWKNVQGLRPNLEKRVKTHGFRNISKKGMKSELKRIWKTKQRRRGRTNAKNA